MRSPSRRRSHERGVTLAFVAFSLITQTRTRWLSGMMFISTSSVSTVYTVPPQAAVTGVSVMFATLIGLRRTSLAAATSSAWVRA